MIEPVGRSAGPGLMKISIPLQRNFLSGLSLSESNFRQVISPAMDAPGSRMKSIREIARYSAVGVLNTVSDIAIFSLLFYLLQIHVLIANTLAFLCAVSQSYLLNKFWTFSAYRDSAMTHLETGRQYFTFIMVNLLCLIVSNVTIFYLAAYLPTIVAKVISAVVVVLIGFALAKALVFRSRAESV